MKASETTLMFFKIRHFSAADNFTLSRIDAVSTWSFGLSSGSYPPCMLLVNSFQSTDGESRAVMYCIINCSVRWMDRKLENVLNEWEQRKKFRVHFLIAVSIFNSKTVHYAKKPTMNFKIESSFDDDNESLLMNPQIVKINWFLIHCETLGKSFPQFFRVNDVSCGRCCRAFCLTSLESQWHFQSRYARKVLTRRQLCWWFSQKIVIFEKISCINFRIIAVSLD